MTKIIPKSIKNQVTVALSFFPNLENVAIEFKFKKQIKNSTMQAQPKFGSLFGLKKNRSYIILISEYVKIENKTFLTKNLPDEVLIGWFGHELGHIVDYESRNSLNLVLFGIKYLLFDKHIIEAERLADTYAVKSGMKSYIMATKNFILNNADISESYKKRIKRYYLSPEEIMQLLQ
ncbi:hypothetical protein [Tenacibaculum jejuense]|uniref:Peptidase M48 domain-containing protein n=1 Tax=Tenacibaculum jejuense TaxID=584609 RepID=A0A238U8H3_9FLAO|nr:hypothetical protein [Tenacibaculum jejuense]SNR15345.1 Protein of unknown function [Tenacibaculum jejuense]